MKKLCISIIMILGILSVATINVNAAEVQVNTGIVGEIKEGSKIDIVVDLQKVTNLYAASMEYTYDNSLLSVESIEVSSNINNGSIHEAYNETANGGNKARYGYTNLGDTQGFSGDTNFLIIKAKVLKDGDLNLTKDNLKVKIVGNNGDISEIPCNINYPEESWEVVKAPTGETTYTSIEAKANSLSQDNASEEVKTAKAEQEGKTSNSTEEAQDTAGEIQATAEEKSAADTTEEDESDATSDNDSQAEENENKDKVSNYWIVGIIVVALIAGGGFFVYKRKSSLEKQAPIVK